jgi:hypothetical protein
VDDSRTVRVVLSDGTEHRGYLHPEWDLKAARSLAGKVWDLSKAYRQLARAPQHASLGIIATWNSHKKCVELFEQPVLPFGAKASVWNFNWVARGLWKILVGLFGFALTHYFDDYPVLEFCILTEHSQSLIDRILELLGWTTKTQQEFAPSFDVLGVVCDLSKSSTGCVTFTNKPKRLEELRTDVERIVASGILRRSEARSLRGRVLFARGQTFGRCGAVALRFLGVLADGRGITSLDERAVGALKWLLNMLLNSRPRELRAHPPPPLLLYVDGACDQTPSGIRVSIGAVLFDPSDPKRGPRYFGTLVGDPVVDLWSKDGKEQLIGQAELLPVLLAKTTWADVFCDRPCIVFIDNDSARFSLIRGYSPVLDSSRIINEVWLFDSRFAVASWYARVPTASNIGDDPSRLVFAVLERYPKSEKFEVSVPSSWGRNHCVWRNVASRLSQEA